MIQATFLRRLPFAGLAIGAVLLSTAMPVAAQTVSDDTVPQTALNLPEQVTLLGENDPNVRRATAVINGEIITGTDVDQRLALILAANEGAVPEEEKARLRLQVLRNLIDETLQIQEARANEIEVDPGEIEQTYARVAQQSFRQDTKALDGYLVRVGSSPTSLKRQIQGELAWSRLLRRNIQPFINVSEDEVNDIMTRLQASKGADEYRIGEIYLSATPENRAEVFENARKIIDQIRQGGNFVAYARQFSEASTAAVGGDLGWIKLALLPPQLSTVASEMGVGQIVGPIEIPGGFSILYLIDRRQVLTADPRDAVLSLKQLSIRFEPGTSEAVASEQAGQFASAMKTIKGCGQADAIAAAAGASVVDNDQVKVRDLPSALQESVLAMSIGETTPPFGSIEEGIRVLVLCGRDDPAAAGGPNFDQMMANLEDERINKRAQIYLRDLRRDAVIDYN